ncbi:hypothetical protein P171DRAFT_476945 [Karstenula rhodostoma CBS 690.94]|uniref:NAD(P)-binding domain-containing protein n=1 Tax=Karstenula rhodostoma CBS 690.94 TaxID=1392251 RepID=A0A9P4P857_9PLEO|nr:hypothetical protein P171DRAFT_476945 [Karstenula rhodostoma CBS 690.94]
MAAPLRKVALVGGSGHLGPYILKALQADSAFDVTVVSRQSSTANFPPNTNVVKVSDVYTKDKILDVFKGHNAVVLSLNFAAEFQHHNMLVDASVEAGVKRLIPFIWGGRIDLLEAQKFFPIAASKASLLDYVRSKVGSAPGWANGLFHDLSFANLRRRPDRTVYISSFETSMNEILAAYKSATGVSGWKVAHDSVDQGIKITQETNKTSQEFMDKMRAIGLLGLLVGVKKGLGGDFAAEGLSDIELLELPRSDVTETITQLLKG